MGSGQAFRLPTPSGYALLGFQKSTTSTRESVKFTVNLRVYTQDEWDYVGSPGNGGIAEHGLLRWLGRTHREPPAFPNRSVVDGHGHYTRCRCCRSEGRAARHAVPALNERAASLLP